ncbi:hypothetical protein [Neorhodopirellula pilleata]|uniref:Uncharacterized protein n=1 Tax=Neorhodopirellula pilleata TaxID=2714738 RepID=A0A5C6ATW4_9BACT|nr:hypothetical protein [Neorhodopirellula pilleata]TWU03435.1 hypothetical protein Pla100_03560 [Neorhodopirellula pilleata]
MSSNIKRISMLAAFAALTLVAAEDAQAQCSRGGRGGGSPGDTSLATGSFTPLNSFASSSNNFASQRQLAYQQQSLAQQRQLIAMRQQQMQQAAVARYEQQQSIQAMRLARAEAKRVKRADRIAALKAKRAAELEGELSGNESGVMLASTVRETYPFE